MSIWSIFGLTPKTGIWSRFPRPSAYQPNPRESHTCFHFAYDVKDVLQGMLKVNI